MTRDDFRRWAETQPKGRFERVGGEPVAMSPERAAHVQVKTLVWLALARAVKAAGLAGCEVFGDGLTVEVDADTDYEPDALVNCGAPVPPDAVAAPHPVIVVEVVSPSSRAVDTGLKFTDYFRVASIQHYLVVRSDRRLVTHHRRDGSVVVSATLEGGTLTLDPPGFAVDVAAFYEPVSG